MTAPAPPHALALRLDDDLALRLRERYLAGEHAARVQQQGEHLARYYPWARGHEEEQSERHTRTGLERFANEDGFEADLCHAGEVVGAVSLRSVDVLGAGAKLDFWLAAEHQGRGLMTRAGRRLVGYVFQRFGVAKVCLVVDAANARGRAVAARLGMQQDAVLRSAHVGGDGGRRDLVNHSLLRREWQVLTAKAPESYPQPPSDRFCLRVDDELELAALERSDAAPLARLVADNEGHLRRWLPWAADPRPASQQAFIDGVALSELVKGLGLNCGIRRSGNLVGTIGLHGVEAGGRCGQLGYWLAATEAGRGTVTRAVAALVERCFALPLLAGRPFERLEVRAAVANRASRAVAERLGFRYEGALRAAEIVGGERVDHAVYSLLRSEWLARDRGTG